MLVRSAGTEKLAVTRNQQWSISALINTAGSVVERYTYAEFGKRTILAANGSTVRTSSSYNMPYGYTSRRHEDETGLMYFRARYYDTNTGEFVSRDPLEYVDGMSQYRGYFSPGAVDPFGLACKLCESKVVASGEKLAALDGEVDGSPYTDLMKEVVGIANAKLLSSGLFAKINTRFRFKFEHLAETGYFAFQNTKFKFDENLSFEKGTFGLYGELHYVQFDVKEDKPGDCALFIMERFRRTKNGVIDEDGWRQVGPFNPHNPRVVFEGKPGTVPVRVANLLKNKKGTDGCECDKRIIFADMPHTINILKDIPIPGTGRKIPKQIWTTQVVPQVVALLDNESKELVKLEFHSVYVGACPGCGGPVFPTE